MTAPNPRAPEPVAVIWIARKPGARPVDVIVGEAEAERAIADLTAALAAIRAGKQAIAAMTAPQAVGVAEATIYCGERHPEYGAYCELDDGHPVPHGYVDAMGFEVEWGGDPAPDASADDGELPANTRYCPDGPTVEHGPCARLAGHPAPHRDGNGREWGGDASDEAAAVLAASTGAGMPLVADDDCPASHPLDGMRCEVVRGHEGKHAYMPFADLGQFITWTDAAAQDGAVPGDPFPGHGGLHWDNLSSRGGA